MKRNCLLALYHLRSNLMFANGFLKSTSLRNENGLLQKKSKRGIRTKFWKKTLEFLDLPLYPQKFWRKQSFIPENSPKLCDTPWIFQDQKPKPIKFLMILSWSLLEIPILFYWPLEFLHALSSIPLEIPCHVLNPPTPGFLLE